MQRMDISPVLHAGGEGVHTGSDSSDDETGLDDRVGVEQHRLNHIENICVSVWEQSIVKFLPAGSQIRNITYL